MKNVIVVCGPTASGKTRLGVELALHHNGEIISCDSRQVYRGMDIGTGKDLTEYHTDRGDVPYHLIDIADPTETYSVYDYKRDFFRVFREITGRRHLPIIVGGTGLYLEAVLRNYDIPETPENPELRDTLMRAEKELLAQELLRIAPDRYASTDLSSKKRIVRSIEIASAKGVAAHHARAQLPEVKPVVLCVVWERERLRERIRERLLARLDAGMVDEVKRLLDSGIPERRFAMFGMEYRHVARYLRHEVDYDKMVTDLQHAIWRLAKRQETWFRGMERRGVKIHWVKEANADEAKEIIGQYTFED